MASTGKIFKKVNGKYAWFDKETGLPESKSAVVHQDTMKKALRHPVTDEIVDSMTRWNRINKEKGLECVGNELLSERKRTVEDKVTEARIMDAMEKAESICSDPTKYRAYQNEQLERRERHEKLVGSTALSFRSRD